jgi:hypothetical protein
MNYRVLFKAGYLEQNDKPDELRRNFNKCAIF